MGHGEIVDPALLRPDEMIMILNLYLVNRIQLVFEEEHLATQFLRDRVDIWKNWFSALQDWNPGFSVQERLASLLNFGIPSQGPATFSEVAKLFGEVIIHEDCRIESKNLAFGRVGILTKQMEWINKSLIVLIENFDHRICIMEDVVDSFQLIPFGNVKGFLDNDQDLSSSKDSCNYSSEEDFSNDTFLDARGFPTAKKLDGLQEENEEGERVEDSLEVESKADISSPPKVGDALEVDNPLAVDQSLGLPTINLSSTKEVDEFLVEPNCISDLLKEDEGLIFAKPIELFKDLPDNFHLAEKTMEFDLDSVESAPPSPEGNHVRSRRSKKNNKGSRGYVFNIDLNKVAPLSRSSLNCSSNSMSLV
ncbi:hypothetical protein OSB04_001733 [Centaurea solstitialis]|uniref:Uncharacterized protein n=1 Tax=Centaurea solstitialis TaxID=347529 RepID=A0AA38U9P4_9ASTR|nr:hypothetical protein OSB04_001733 [Centaurea solstitialis]